MKLIGDETNKMQHRVPTCIYQKMKYLSKMTWSNFYQYGIKSEEVYLDNITPIIGYTVEDKRIKFGAIITVSH